MVEKPVVRVVEKPVVRVVEKKVYRTVEKPVVKVKEVIKYVERKAPVRRRAPVRKAPVRKAASRPGCHWHKSNSMTKSMQHCHKGAKGGNHNHQYGPKRMAPRPAVKRPPPRRVVRRPAPRRIDRNAHRHMINGVSRTHTHPGGNGAHNHNRRAPAAPKKPVNRWCHSHPANSMTKSVQHCHKYNQVRHNHRYAGNTPRVAAPAPAPTTAMKPIPRRIMAPKAPAAPKVDVFALQRKLKAKGYYRGPIDGVVGSGTRSALQQFMQNRQ